MILTVPFREAETNSQVTKYTQNRDNNQLTQALIITITTIKIVLRWTGKNLATTRNSTQMLTRMIIVPCRPQIIIDNQVVHIPLVKKMAIITTSQITLAAIINPKVETKLKMLNLVIRLNSKQQHLVNMKQQLATIMVFLVIHTNLRMSTESIKTVS